MHEIRYGVFLRPDPATCWHVTQATFALERQFGLVSAGAFPPHCTLVGNLATEAAEEDLVAALDPVLSGLEVFPVHNAGLRRAPDHGYAYDVDLDERAAGVNVRLHRVADAVLAAVRPLSVPVRDRLVTPVEEYRFAGHIGLAGHELAVDPSLSDEVGAYLEDLPIAPPPASFLAQWYSLLELRADWTADWWRAMTWRHRRSWRVR